ncbi:hypothetical protein E5288_WYG002066 [Bos mutus]|uniref:Deoxyribonuclease-2-beta n=1 Tax=Bos mutus TaxID=72004 RepID=A0A6B0RDJ9_9CETA|nr:hypothetical protein [Bos mutus]
MTARLLVTLLTVLFLGLFGILEATKISCRNEEGEAVDWFTFYKLPKKQNEESRETGLEYLYLDSTTRSWSRSKQLMNATKSVLGRTLQQLYEASASESNSTAYLIYNDGVPKSVNYSRKYGHTKGVLLWNRVQGFWLIHSIPHFPPVPEEGYDYPPTGRRNGQAGMCITFKYNQYEAIDSQLLVYNPNIYSCSIPAAFHMELIHIPQLCAGSSSSEIPGRHLATLQSAQGQKFLHFAKSDSFLDGNNSFNSYNTSSVGVIIMIGSTFDFIKGFVPENSLQSRKENELYAAVRGCVQLIIYSKSYGPKGMTHGKLKEQWTNNS